jgi:two-component system, NtrC family, sensor kinase
MKTIRKIFFFALLFLYFHAISQQNTLVDSLKKSLSSKLPDTTKVMIYEQIGRSLMYSNPDTALIFANQGLELANKIDYLKGQSRSLNRIGSIECYFGRYDIALQKLLNAVNIAESIHDDEGQAKAYINIGILYSDQKDTKNAAEYYLKSERISKKINNQPLLILAYMNLGANYSRLLKLDSALYYTEKGYNMALATNNDGVNILVNNLADLYYANENYAKAKKFFQRSIVYSKKINANRTLASSYYVMALIYRDTQKPDSCLFYATQSYKMSVEAKNLEFLNKSAKLLSELYEKQNPVKALEFYKKSVMAKDSMFSQEKTRQIQALSLKEKMLTKELDFSTVHEDFYFKEN